VGCRNKQGQSEVQRLSTRFNLLYISESISTQAKDLVETYFLSHGLLIPDAMLAATAIENNITLFTKNIRHFQMIEGLKVNRPY
jgi:predicted nucleic acid-binding protein